MGHGLLALLTLALPGSLRAWLTYANIAPVVFKGVDTLIHEGLKVAVLDAVALSVTAGRGEFFTTNLTKTLLVTGEYLEHHTARESESLIVDLLAPAAGSVWVEREGEVRSCPARELVVGDTVWVGPGETIAVDGEILHGEALINQASITGEDVPVRRFTGERVLSGTVVEEGNVRLRALQVGEDTTTARINRFLLESLQSRSNTQQVTQAMADRRVLITLGVGSGAFALTRDPRRVAAVFLVDYGCVLKLSTPISFKGGMYRAARHGVLLKGAKAIEDLATVDAVAFDKTGTLTRGELDVTQVISFEPTLDGDALLALAAALEEHARHPIASALVAAAAARGLDHPPHGDVEHLVARGVRSTYRGRGVWVGSRAFVEGEGGVDFSHLDDRIHALEAAGQMVLHLAWGDRPLGLIALKDELRPEARRLLNRLRRQGVQRLVLLTGDRTSKAEALGARLPLDQVHGDLSPEGKAAIIRRLQARGRRVAFVGDGVNDAPALTTADVGIAMPRGADVARHMADVVLTEDHLGGVAAARQVAVDTMGLIHGNIRFAEIFNSGVMAGAALGLLSPVASAVLHNGSTLAVMARAVASTTRRPLERLGG